MKVKFLCLNLWNTGMLFDQAADFISKENPDIIALQEVSDARETNIPQKFHSLEKLEKLLEYSYVNFAPANMMRISEDMVFPYGNGILSKFPIKTTQTYFYDIPFGEITWERGPDQFLIDPRSLQEVCLLIDGKEISVFNTQGIWGLDGDDNERRLAMAKTILDAVGDKENVIVAGDFNIKPNTKTIHLLEQKLHNVFKNELTTTFNMKRKDNPGYATAVVDMIFVSPAIKVIDHYCLQVDISDHLPLLANFEL